MSEGGEPLDTTDLTQTARVAEADPRPFVKHPQIGEAQEAQREAGLRPVPRTAPHAERTHHRSSEIRGSRTA